MYLRQVVDDSHETSRGGAPNDSTATKLRILEAATAEYAEHGFAGARIERIANHANANKQLIYRYFGNKQELYDAVLKEMTRRSREMLSQEQERGLSYLDFLSVYESGLPTAAVHSMWARILGWEGMTNATETAEVDQLRRENFRTRRDWVAADQESGRVANHHRPEFLVAVLMAAATFPTTMPRTFQFILDRDEVTEETKREWFAFIRDLIGDNANQNLRLRESSNGDRKTSYPQEA